MEDRKWKLESDLCRCCLTEGVHINLGVPTNDSIASGEKEDYANMLLENLGIRLLPVKGMLSDITYTICHQCVERLRDVASFKKQVQISEEKFWDLYGKNTFVAGETVVVKIERDMTDESKVDMDDGLNIDDFSDEDTKLNLKEIKAEAKKAKGKSKAKPRAAKKSAARKTASRKAKSKVGDAKIKKEDPAEDGNAAHADAPDDAEPSAKRPRRSRAANFRLQEADYETEGNEYVCKHCQKRYDKMCSLKFHVKTKHYKIPRFTCPICLKEFMTPAPLTAHKLEAHEIDERHHCNACRGAFNTKVQLRKHINNFHMLGERYKCEFCDYESFSFEGMYKHKFKHKTVKDYHCRFCRKSFLRKTTLDLHERIHTGDRRKVCSVCGQAFVQKASLNYHMAKYHPEVNF